MICAISPASDNFEESLSTLRYADRAKKIVNKAVVNESVQDKMIRNLREENEKLMAALQEALRSGKAIDLEALGIEDQSTNRQDIENQVRDAEVRIQEMEKTWEEKLRQQKERDLAERQREEEQQKMKILKDKKAPHLTNLNEDTQLSGKLHYSLANLASEQFTAGRDPSCNIVLRGVGIQ